MSETVEIGSAQGVRALLSIKEELELLRNEILNSNKKLAETTYQASVLYDRWVVEHQTVARREAEMLKSIETFDEKLEDLEALKDEISKTIQSTVSKAAVMVADLAGKETLKKFKESIDPLKRDLSDVVYRAKEVIHRYEDIETHERWKMWGAAVLVAVLVGFAVGGVISWVYKPSYSAMLQAIRHK